MISPTGILVVIDEMQRAFGHKHYGEALDEALTDLAKVGPSAGIMLLAGTQKPDSKSTPTGFGTSSASSSS